MTFKKFNLDPAIIKAIEELKFTTPTPIQESAIPHILDNRDVFASAQTGTGKTAAFGLPAVQKLVNASTLPGKGARILILAPIRELAMQISDEFVKFGKYLEKAKTVCIFGGVPYDRQRRKLSMHYDILIATPGRLMDFMQQKKINFARTEMVILDEADRMLDMGFIKDVKQIVKSLPQQHQTLLFSATLNKNVLNLAKDLLKNPIEINIEGEQKNFDHIKQQLHKVKNLKHKNNLLNHILDNNNVNQAIIFTATKYYADELTDELNKRGHLAAALHGNIRQNKRTKTIASFRDNKLKVLVATDVASRGIDITNVSHVINFDLPQQAEDYVHRIGRTGRAGSTGSAISFVSDKDRHMVGQIEKFLKKKLSYVDIPELQTNEPMPDTDTPGSFHKRKPKRSFDNRNRRNFSFKSKGRKSGFKDRRNRSQKKAES